MNRFQDSLIGFLKFLEKQGALNATRHNYATDIRHLIKFLEAKKAGQFSSELFLEYRNFLPTTSLSLKSINRKLSALRKFGEYLKSAEALSKNPAEKIKNITSFTKKLTEIKLKKPEIKLPALFLVSLTFILVTVFISVILFRRPKPPLPPPASLSSAKMLTFQSQLTDAQGKPRKTLTLATFRLWDQKKGGNQLYSSGFCFVKPDQNGLFSIVIGQDCGKKIPSSFFSKYDQIYLEMEIDGEEKKFRTPVLDTSPTFFTLKETLHPTPKQRDTDEEILEKTLNLLTTLKDSPPASQLPTDEISFSGGSRLFEKEGRVATDGDFEVRGKIIDGGLGIFGTQQGVLPSTFDFTKSLTLEFDFQTGKEKFELVLKTQTGKAYYCAWDNAGVFAIGKTIDGIKTEFLQVIKTWQDETWFQARISLQQSILSFKVSGTVISAPIDIHQAPLTKTGTIEFGGDIQSLTNLRLFSGERAILATGEAEVQEGLTVKGKVTTNLTGQTSINEVCWQGNMDTAQLVACSSGADLAEYYQAEEEVEAGDLVSISHRTIEQSNNPPAGEAGDAIVSLSAGYIVKKSRRSYDPNLIGVISTLPWRIMGQATLTPNSKPVALAGRVPVKVKGEISVGDPLTSSETPGIAQKATQEGLILGRALEACQPTNDTGSWTSFDPVSKELASADCKILAFINISWFKPETSITTPGVEQQTPGVEELAEPENNWEEPLTLPGDLTVLGKTQKLTIKENAGTAVLPTGQSQLLITNYSITPNSLIFLTPLSSTGNQTLYVKLKNPSESFVVGIDKPLGDDIPFNWLIVN